MKVCVKRHQNCIAPPESGEMSRNKTTTRKAHGSNLFMYPVFRTGGKNLSSKTASVNRMPISFIPLVNQEVSNCKHSINL